jgi:hypothetical protein
MLIGFKFQNFRSFLTEQTFGFSASSDHTHESTHLMSTGLKSVPRVSKAAIAFGPNASGKTNLLAGFATFRDLILNCNGYSDSQYRDRHTPFRFGPGRPTDFEFDVLLGQVRYRYAISYDAQRIRSERLLVYRTGKSQRWFERHYNPATETDEWAPFSPSLNGPRELWRKSTRPRALFLTTARQLGCRQLGPLMDWVGGCMEILFPTDLSDLNRFATRIQDPNFKARVLELLRAADIQVADVRIAHGGAPPKNAPAPRPPGTGPTGAARDARQSIEFLYTRAGWSPVWLDSVFESAGTLRLMGLLVPFLDAIERGKLLLIDEFDTSIHPLIARFLVKLIVDPSVSKQGAQLLLTSHNTTLMDLDFLRRDEIWLVQLNENRTSGLSPLVRASPRKHEMIAKNYLKGRYGAIPRVDTE